MPHVALLEAHVSRTGEAGKALARLLNQACVYLLCRGDRTGALVLAQQAVTLKRLTRREDPLGLAIGLGNQAKCYVDLDRIGEAEDAYREAMEIMERHVDPTDPRLADMLCNFGEVHWRRGAFAESERLNLRAAEIIKAAHGTESAEYVRVIGSLGVVYGDWAEATQDAAHFAKAKECLAVALTVMRKARRARHPATAQAHKNLAVLKSKEHNDAQGATTESERSVAIMLSLGLTESHRAENYAEHLAQYWEQSGQADKAERLRAGDVSDLLRMIAQIEAEHRAWVAEDPENRHFGPPSPFASQCP
jgi:tetratricopeptide (TPR) repeat protein